MPAQADPLIPLCCRHQRAHLARTADVILRVKRPARPTMMACTVYRVVPEGGLVAKPLTKLSISDAARAHDCYLVVSSPRRAMVKPKTKPQKTPPAGKDAGLTAPVVPTSAFSIGDAVHHHMFGDGKVEGIEDDKLTIAFERQVTKVIRQDFVTRKR